MPPATPRKARPATPHTGAGTDVTLPRVTMNMAMTADGKIATASGGLSSFGSPRDHQELLRLRSLADGIMAGARTVDQQPVTMGSGSEKFRRSRIRAGRSPEPLRIIVSGSGSLNPEAEVFKNRFSPIIVLTSGNVPDRRRKMLQAVADDVRSFGTSQIDFRAALCWLRSAHGIRDLLCEGGGELNDALFAAGLVDELHITVCPFIFGGRKSPTIAEGAGVPRLALARNFKLQSIRRVGLEHFLVYGKD